MRRPFLRRAVAVSGLVGALTLLARPAARAGTDVFSNIGPAPSLGGSARWLRYPLTHYGLDQHFSAITTSLTGGIDTSGLLPMIAWFFASFLWLLTSAMSWVIVELFAFAFSLDLVNGSSATGGAGALGPVSQAIHSIYANVFGAPWLVLALSAVAIWAMWKALVQRRYSETAGALALSLIYIVVAFFFVVEPGQTIGAASGWTNEMSQAFLSISSHGDPSGGEAASADDADQLWSLMVAQPWSVLEFGGLEHCAIDGTGDENSDPESAPVRPLSADPGLDAALARRLAAGTEVAAEGKTCINNENKYASHFLRFGFGTAERNEEYDALDHGDSSKLPAADEEKAGYKLGVADKPATDAMEEGGQYQRLGLAIVVAIGDLGAFLLLGSLSILVILSQVLLLLLLAFSPVALVAAAIPGRGHDFFKAWLEKLGGYLLRKAAYSLVLAVLLAVNSAIAGATSDLGWLFSFGLQSIFFWAVLIQRRSLLDGIVGIATGPRSPGGDLALDAIGLYAGARLGFGSIRGAGRAARGAGGFAARRFGNRRADRKRSHPAGLFGVHESRTLDHGRGRSGGGGDGGAGGNGTGNGPGGTGGGPGGNRTGGGPAESTAAGSTPESVAAPSPDPEGKAAGGGAEAVHGKRVTANRAQDGPASAGEGDQEGPTSGAAGPPPPGGEAGAGKESASSGSGPARAEVGAGGATESRVEPPPPPKPGRGRRGGAGNADPASVTDDERAQSSQQRRPAAPASRPRPESRESSGGQVQPGTATAKGSGLSDDLRAERERANLGEASPQDAGGPGRDGPSEEPPTPREPAAPGPPEEPSSPPRRRRRLRLRRRGVTGR